MGEAVIRPLGRPGDLGWVVQAHGEIYAAEVGWGAPFEALVARIVADFADDPDPHREAAWIAEIDGRRVGCVFCTRADELAVLERVRHAGATGGPSAATEAIWAWLAAPEHRALLTLWLEAYARALVERDGVWAGFAARTVRDWLGLLAELGPQDDGDADRTLLLAVLRGCLLDLLATGDVARTSAAVDRYLRMIDERRVAG